MIKKIFLKRLSFLNKKVFGFFRIENFLIFRCHSYFPHKDAPISKWEHFECELEHEEIKPNYIIRRIRLTPLDSFLKRSKQLSDNYITPNNSPTKSIESEEIGENTTNLQQTSNVVGENKSRTIHHFQVFFVIIGGSLNDRGGFLLEIMLSA